MFCFLFLFCSFQLPRRQASKGKVFKSTASPRKYFYDPEYRPAPEPAWYEGKLKQTSFGRTSRMSKKWALKGPKSKIFLVLQYSCLLRKDLATKPKAWKKRVCEAKIRWQWSQKILLFLFWPKYIAE